MTLSLQNPYEPFPLPPGGILGESIPGERVIPRFPNAEQAESNPTASDFKVLFDMEGLPRQAQLGE